MVDYTRFIPGVKDNKSELTIYINRSGRICPSSGEKDPDTIEISLIGADDPDSIRGIYLDGCVLDEYAQCDPIIWGQIVRPALADRKKIAHEMGIFKDTGGMPIDPWAIFIGTPKGRNHFHNMYDQANEAMSFSAEYETTHDVREEIREWYLFEKKHGITDETPYAEVERIMNTWTPGLRGLYADWRKYKSAKNWFTIILKASETAVLDRDEIDEMKSTMSKEEIEQELECSFTAAIVGSYYGHLINQLRESGHIGQYAYNPKYPVDTYWDIGIGDKTTIWFVQRINPSTYHYIDYFEADGLGIDDLKRVIDAKSGSLGTRVEIDPDREITILGRGYEYGRHVWPHDGQAKEFGSGQTRQETARQKGLIVEIQPKQTIEDRINAARTRLKISYFDEKSCKRGIECLYNYMKERDDKLMMFKNKPLHNWASHGSDSYGYSALDDRPSYFPGDRRRGRKDEEYNQALTDYDEFSYGRAA